MGKSPVRDLAKTRKPYTITKQREKWTDEEHNKFLEALKLYGRAWQRIHDHIGTKTAVQIRSHAQKFFLKLEKGNEGMTPGHPYVIEIPPPRPKRKPYSSYARKTGATSRSPSEEIKEKSLSKAFALLGTDKVEPAKPVIEQNKKQAFGEGTSICFPHKGTSERSQQMPTLEDLEETRSRITKELRKTNADLQIFGISEYFTDSQFVFTTEEKRQVFKQMVMPFTSSKKNLKGGQSHEKIHAQLDENAADLNLSLSSARTGTHRTKNSSLSSIHQEFPSFSLHNQFDNDDNPFNALISLTNHFPSLLASALSQNPAVHQAARIAAASLPPTYVDFSMQPNTKLVSEALEKQSSASSSILAVVTATIAAASAWWRVHGLLPSPFQPNHSFTQVMAQATESTQVHEDNSDSKENANHTHCHKFQQINYPEHHETNRKAQPCSALLEPSSSPDTCESTKIERPPKSTKSIRSSICGMHDVNHVPDKKKHDPSSCDSNTSPSSEVDKDVGLNNKEEAKGINEQGEQCPSIIQAFRDTPRNSKSCTENLIQGSLAFEELLSPMVLPQSFLPLHLDGNWAINSGNEEAFGLQIDLNRKVITASTCDISKERAQSSSDYGSEVVTLKRRLVETKEKHNTDKEENSRKRASL